MGFRTFSKTSSQIMGTAESASISKDYIRNSYSGGPAQSPPVAEDSKFDTMYFRNYGTNTFIETAKDRLSTFSLDVDTASYTVSKNYIMRGELPPTDAIRPEEFINYFDYSYPNPKETFGIYSEIAPSPFESNLHYLKVGIKSREIENRKDAILTFVVDVSGSMDMESRIGLAKKSLTFLVEQLREGDEIGIVKYNTDTELVLEHTSVQEKQKILDAIDSLMPGGSTNADAGLRLGYDQADKAFKPNKINRVILISDGVANVGQTNPDSIINQLKKYTDKGIYITAIGVGLGNYNDVLLEQIADKGDGNYYYINDFSEAKKVFSAQLSGTLQAVAKDAKIQVEFNPDVVAKYKLIGYENRVISDENFRNDSQDAGEIGAGHEVTALYEIELKNKNAKLGDVYLRYTVPETNSTKEINVQISNTNIKEDFGKASDRFKMAVSVARFAQILKLVQPPPSIVKVSEIVNSIEPIDDTEKDFRTVLANAKRLIEIKQGE
jgi:Ca-activated chloride channel homolog